MPVYTFKNLNTGEEHDETFSWEEMEKYLKKNKKTMQRVFKPIALGDAVGLGIRKPPEDFQKHVLGRIKEKTKGPAIASKRWNIPREW